uniref:Short transient receptor potential channel 2-like protein isoform X2 n=1 Tax=Geotrypetes seraphini TaxID=260995 RepID=A0A6P8R284_GEOSA|nr:putative short transient receptor potential channel 2-like protein isoform X2 [Geotrypetes seraphini]
MAPIKLRHVVSFSSQDPRYPVENLLRDSGVLPWLSCPRDRSRQLRVELQLEQASLFGYVDIGNCGSALLQIDVGRSSWPPDRPYVTLLPATTLMTPANCKLGENRTSVRMFKEGDFLPASLSEKWDRVRITCSQPFHKHSQFGLSFLRFRTPLDEEKNEMTEGQRMSENETLHRESDTTPWLSNPSVRRTFFPETQTSAVEETLKSRLQQLDPGSAPHIGNSVCLSRTARMVILAARSRRLIFPPGGSRSVEERKYPQEEDRGASVSHSESGSCPESSGAPPMKKVQQMPSSKRKARQESNRGRFVSRTSPGGLRQRTRGGKGQKGQNGISQMRSTAVESGPRRGEEAGSCPICGGSFQLDFLPLHASRCGEVVDLEESSSSSEEALHSGGISFSHTEESPWVSCPLCGFRYSASVIEQHASRCGEQESSGTSSPWVE